MKYSRSKLMLQTTKEIGKDVENLSKRIGNGTFQLTKAYGEGCYNLYLGDAHFWGDYHHFNDTIKKSRDRSMYAYLGNVVLSFAGIIVGLNGHSDDILVYSLLFGSTTLLFVPGAKYAVKSAYKSGKNYFHKKIDLAHKNLESSI